MKTYKLLKYGHNENPELIMESVSLQAVVNLKHSMESSSGKEMTDVANSDFKIGNSKIYDEACNYRIIVVK